ncbi:hypothetical protein KKA14_13955, partial [bacterium]|nr:hypothetical protein [bacterium]
SSRIHQAALRQYHYITAQLGIPQVDAQIFATYLIINQAGYGKFGTTRMGNGNNRQLLECLAGSHGLIPLRKQRILSTNRVPN